MGFFNKRIGFGILVWISVLVSLSIFFPIFKSVGAQPSPPVVIAKLVNTIEGSQFSPPAPNPAPDPAGITYLSDRGTLLISDSEVNEMPIFKGANLFEITFNGSVVRTADTTSEPISTNEPTGISVNPGNNHLFISNDDAKKIFEIDPGPDGQYLTADDTVSSFSTQGWGSTDPEDVVFGQGNLFVIDGVGQKVYQATLEGSLINSFDVSQFDLLDPEGITFDSSSRTLFILDRRTDIILETTLTGVPIRQIDISAANAKAPAGLVWAPSSDKNDPSSNKNLYLVARGVDNNTDPNENDGMIYEMSVSGSVSSPTPTRALTPTPTTGCAGLGDVNCDGAINIIDMRLVLAAWQTGGTPANNYREDANSDQKVNSSDAAQVVNDWSCQSVGEGCQSSFDCCLGLVCDFGSKSCRVIVEAEKYFQAQVQNDESFCLKVNNDQAIKAAWDTYQSDCTVPGVKCYGPNGPIIRDNGGFNYGYGCLTKPDCLAEEKGERWWTWQIDSEKVVMTEASIEICDGLPSAVEYRWLEGRGYCPWNTQLVSLGCLQPL